MSGIIVYYTSGVELHFEGMSVCSTKKLRKLSFLEMILYLDYPQIGQFFGMINDIFCHSCAFLARIDLEEWHYF